MADDIRPGERRELKSLVRARMKVLRAEVDDKHAEQLANIHQRVAAKFADDNRRFSQLERELERLTATTNEDFREIMSRYSDVADTQRGNNITKPWVSRKNRGRSVFERALTTAIHSERHKALLALDRLEADLITRLALDALKTEAAQAFVREIPALDTLMPGTRIEEIENNFVPGDDE